MKTLTELQTLLVTAIQPLIGMILSELPVFSVREGEDRGGSADAVATIGLNGHAIDTKLGSELNPGKKPGVVNTIEVWFPGMSRDELLGRGFNTGAVVTLRIDDLKAVVREDETDPAKRYSRLTLRPKAPGAITITHKAVSGDAMFAG